MEYWLVLQFDGKGLADYDALIDLENQIERELGDSAVVDGHDFGSGEGNIFIRTDDPRAILKRIDDLLSTVKPYMRVAFRHHDEDDYTPLWPPDLGVFEVK